MKKLKLYLAHNFNDRKEIRKLEKILENTYNIELLNPFYDQKRSDVRKLDKMGEEKTKYHRQQWDISKCAELVERDLNSIDNCDGILTILDTPSFGTAMEIFYCAFLRMKPVYIITKNFLYHPWLRYMVDICCGELFTDISQFEEWLNLNGY